MEQIAGKIVVRMKETKMISEDESEKYIYGVQVVLEKIISYISGYGAIAAMYYLKTNSSYSMTEYYADFDWSANPY